MKRARLDRLGEPLVVRDEPDPDFERELAQGIRRGGVAVRMRAAGVISYSKEVFAGRQGAASFPLPFTPGAGGIGVVEKVADDVEGVAAGERVLLTSYLQSNDGLGWLLLGWTGTSAALRRAWPYGTFAERVVWPATCVTPLRDLDDGGDVAVSVLGTLVVPYGGLLAAGVAPGHVVAVNGANGCFGAAGVVMALALGASRILAVGRDAEALARLRDACGGVVVPVALRGDEAKDIAALRDASAGGPHHVLDFVGQTHDPSATRACVRALRRGGTAVFMGGMHADVPIPYGEAMLRELVIRGCFMHPPSAPANLVRLVASGRVPLDVFQTTAFDLERIGDAVEHAAHDKGLRATVVTMA